MKSSGSFQFRDGLVSLDLISGEVRRSHRLNLINMSWMPALSMVFEKCSSLGEARIDLIQDSQADTQSKPKISVLTSWDRLQRLTSSTLNPTSLCILSGEFCGLQVYFWSGAGWTVSVQDGELKVCEGAPPLPWAWCETAEGFN
jgi:hypothetical protein